jgi:hypothetical protein
VLILIIIIILSFLAVDDVHFFNKHYMPAKIKKIPLSSILRYNLNFHLKVCLQTGTIC